MAKNKDTVTLIEKFRGHAWVNHCMKVAGCNQSGLSKLQWMEHSFQFQAGIDREQLKELGKIVEACSNKDNWSKYKGGIIKPYHDFVEGLLHGTNETWNSPLWSILDANQEEVFLNGLQVSNEFLEAELANQVSRSGWWLLSKKPIASMTVEEKTQALLEASVPLHYWHRNNYVDRFPEDEESKGSIPLKLVDRDEVFFTLTEFIEMPNALSLAYKEGKKKRFREGIGKGEYRILDKKRLVAFIALIVICGNTTGLRSLHEFLKTGIQEALVDSFGQDVADYVKSEKHI